VVSLSRYFVKEAAFCSPGSTTLRGAVLFMDADGQHPPALIENWSATGSTAVTMSSIPPKAHRGKRAEASAAARRQCFYSLINWGARQKTRGRRRLPAAVAARRAALRQMRSAIAFFKGLASWIGFRQLRSDYEPATRIHGAQAGASDRYRPVGRRPDVVSVAPLRLASLLGILLAAGAHRVQRLDFDRGLCVRAHRAGLSSIIIGIMVIGGVRS